MQTAGGQKKGSRPYRVSEQLQASAQGSPRRYASAYRPVFTSTTSLRPREEGRGEDCSPHLTKEDEDGKSPRPAFGTPEFQSALCFSPGQSPLPPASYLLFYEKESLPSVGLYTPGGRIWASLIRSFIHSASKQASKHFPCVLDLTLRERIGPFPLRSSYLVLCLEGPRTQ